MSDRVNQLNMRASARWLARVRQASDALEKPVSQIVREAVDEKLDELAAKYPELSRRAQQQRAA